MNTKSASPPVMICVGMRGSMISPTAPVMIPALSRIPAKLDLIALPTGMRAFGINPPDETSIRSTPKSFRCRDKTTDRSASEPPSTQSVVENPHEDRHLGGQFPDFFRDPQHEPHAIFEAAAVLVGVR